MSKHRYPPGPVFRPQYPPRSFLHPQPTCESGLDSLYCCGWLSMKRTTLHCAHKEETCMLVTQTAFWIEHYQYYNESIKSSGYITLNNQTLRRHTIANFPSKGWPHSRTFLQNLLLFLNVQNHWNEPPIFSPTIQGSKTTQIANPYQSLERAPYNFRHITRK